MDLIGKIVVITGGAGGIGRGLAERFMKENAKAVVVADIDRLKTEETAASIGCFGQVCDVADPTQIAQLVQATEERFGPIDLFCSNAGILEVDPDPGNAVSAPDEAWARSWSVNVMAHVYAARALLPGMIARRGGYLLNTASAAGLLTQIGGGPYAVTKHAAIGFAEHLAITHRDDGIRISVLCPQGVDTAMARQAHMKSHPALADGVLTPAQVAEAVVEGLTRESFLILPHATTAEYFAKKCADYDRWIGGMAKLRRTTL